MNIEVITTFGHWVKSRRKILDLTQEMLAQQVGCSLAAIKKIESGERHPSRQIAGLMADHLKVPTKLRATFISAARGEYAAYALPPPTQDFFVPDKIFPDSLQSTIIRTSLPTPVAPLIGREHELTEIMGLMQDPRCRLLTLTGLGGIGKTRLALESAHRLQTIFPDGAGYVSLIGVSSPEFIIPTIADELGITFSGPTSPKAQLFKYLKMKHYLLVLDNLEHLIAGVEILGELLLQAPKIRLLTTSREQLHLQAEWVLEIQGLPVPQSTQVEDLENVSSVALFLQRARQANVGFTFSSIDRPALVRICQLVKGLPLAIELAAAWTRMLTCQEIVQEIECCLDFLSGNTFDVPERHRSITAVFDHSWKLLSPDEQNTLKRLSVFQGGFSREAAEQIAGATLQMLAVLVDKSLVRRSGTGRYDIHELISQYLLVQLNNNEEEERVTREQHSRYYLTLLLDREVILKSQRQKAAVTELMADIDNIRLAWNEAIENGMVDVLVQASGPLYFFYELNQYFIEGATCFKVCAKMIQGRLTVLRNKNETPDKKNLEIALGNMLNYQAFFTLRPGNYREALLLFQDSLALLRPHGSSSILAFGLIHKGAVHMALGELEAASELFNEGLTVSYITKDSWLQAMAFGLLGGVLHNQGKYQEAYRSISESISLCQSIGDPYLTILMGAYYSHTAQVVGHLLETQDLFSESLRIARESGNRWGIGTGLMIMSTIARLQGNDLEARSLLEESVVLNREVGDLWSLAWALNDLSFLSLKQGDLQTAERCVLEAFTSMVEAGNPVVALEALVILASIRSQSGMNLDAFEITVYILQNPSITTESRNRAEKLQAEIAAMLTASEIETARACAQARSIHDLIGEPQTG
ncbi:MAG: hypothetical protein CVU39_07150 [Chloroflexi bacterium HGW-Chloroflexi-10]|nr:MAG: hypothetical protein CVU39_07150 [Chloroflexi bacterium HGW-Chloroflexi-10]